MIAWSTFYRSCQVEHDFMFGCRFTPLLKDSISEFNGKLRLRLRERFEAIIEGKAGT